MLHGSIDRKNYSVRVGEKTKEVLDIGLGPAPQDFSRGGYFTVPSFEMNENHEILKVKGEPRVRVYKCALSEVWKEYAEEKLGGLYCYVDPAEYMAYDPNCKLANMKALPDGDDYYEPMARPTAEQERKHFSSEKKDGGYIGRSKEMLSKTMKDEEKNDVRSL